jgi:hypothetical protein
MCSLLRLHPLISINCWILHLIKGYFTQGSQLKDDQDDEEVSPLMDTTPYISFMTYQSVEDSTSEQLDDTMTSGSGFCCSSIELCHGNTIRFSRCNIESCHTTAIGFYRPSTTYHQSNYLGQPYGMHYTEDKLFKYVFDLCTGC